MDGPGIPEQIHRAVPTPVLGRVLRPLAARRANTCGGPGPYLALLVNLVCALPVLIWNCAASVDHRHPRGRRRGTGQRVEANPEIPGRIPRRRSRLAEPDLLRRHRLGRHRLLAPGPARPAPGLFLQHGRAAVPGLLLHSFRSRVLPNWIAPSVLPLFCLMVIYWDTRVAAGRSANQTLAHRRPGAGIRRGRDRAQHRPGPEADRPAPAREPGSAAPRARLERRGPRRRRGQTGIARGRQAGLHHRRPLRPGRRDLLLPARGQGDGGDRPAGLLPNRLPGHQPILLLARLREPQRPECHLRPRIGSRPNARPGPVPPKWSSSSSR